MTDIDIDALQGRVDDFNADHYPGSWVRYWTGTRDDAPKYGQTRAKAELLGGHTPVVWVTTHGACVALTHVDVIPGQPDGIDNDSRDLPELGGAAERVGEYIAANGDGIYDLIDGHPLYARDLEALRRATDHVWVAEQYKAGLAAARDEVEKLRAELDRARAVVEAARQAVNTDDVDEWNELVDAVDALPKAEAQNLICGCGIAPEGAPGAIGGCSPQCMQPIPTAEATR